MRGLASLSQRRQFVPSVKVHCPRPLPQRRLQSTSYPEASLLLELLSPSTALVVADTSLGRGLVSPNGSAKGSVLLDVDWCNVITVTDDPDKAGSVYGQQALEDWQLIHGELPPLLRSFLLSGQAPKPHWMLGVAKHASDPD